MATVTLVPTVLTDLSSNVASGAVTDVDNTIASADDGALVVTVTDQWVAGSIQFALSDLPGDFDTCNTAQFRVRGRFVNPGAGDTCDYNFSLSGTNTPTTTAALWDETDDGSGFENRGAASGESCSATEAQINAWEVIFDQLNYTKDKGPDNFYFDLSEIEVIIDYDVAAAGADELDFERGTARGVVRGIRGIG